MGTTFSTLQIKNHYNIEPERFKKSLSKYFKKKGLTIATEEDFQFSYRLAFSDKSNWVTLSCPDTNLMQDGFRRTRKDWRKH